MYLIDELIDNLKELKYSLPDEGCSEILIKTETGLYTIEELKINEDLKLIAECDKIL